MKIDGRIPGILIFAGTTEGRMLAEYVSGINQKNKGCTGNAVEHPVRCFVCTATGYGKRILDNLPGVAICAGRMDSAGIQHFIEKNNIDLVIDATHPFAGEVTANIKSACAAANMKIEANNILQKSAVRYVRCLRERGEHISGENIRATAGGAMQNAGDSAVWTDSVSQAVSYLKKTTGNILIATGSKELHLYTEIENYRQRCFARVLSTREAVEKSVDLGFEGRHLIAMQGPFSVEMNLALLKQTEAAWFVTKESGATGGFEEKLKAARLAQAVPVIVGRPYETGESLKTVKEMIKQIAVW